MKRKIVSGIMLTLLVTCMVMIVPRVALAPRINNEIMTLLSQANKSSMVTDTASGGEEVYYDDGEVDYGWSCTHPGGAAVRFTPPKTPWLLTTIKTHGSYGSVLEPSDGIFYVEVWDSNRNELFHNSYKYSDYFQFMIMDWTVIDIPDIAVAGDFYICIFTNWVQGEHILWQSADNDPPIEQRSYVADMITHEIGSPKTDTDWMIRAIGKLSTMVYFNLNPNPASVGENVTLKGILVDQFSWPTAGETVKLYARPIAGSWRYITSLTTNTLGIFTWQAKIPVEGTFIFAVYYPGSEAYESSYNLAILIVR